MKLMLQKEDTIPGLVAHIFISSVKIVKIYTGGIYKNGTQFLKT